MPAREAGPPSEPSESRRTRHVQESLFVAAVALAIAAVGCAGGDGAQGPQGSQGNTGNPGNPGNPGPSSATTGVNVAVVSVSTSSPITVRFTLKDDRGYPARPRTASTRVNTPIQPRFALALLHEATSHRRRRRRHTARRCDEVGRTPGSRPTTTRSAPRRPARSSRTASAPATTLHVPDRPRRQRPGRGRVRPDQARRDARRLDPGDAADRPGLPPTPTRSTPPTRTTYVPSGTARRSSARSLAGRLQRLPRRVQGRDARVAARVPRRRSRRRRHVQRLPQPGRTTNPSANSASFIHRIHNGERVATGEPVPRHRGDVPAGHPQLQRLPRRTRRRARRRLEPVDSGLRAATTTSRSRPRWFCGSSARPPARHRRQAAAVQPRRRRRPTARRLRACHGPTGASRRSTTRSRCPIRTTSWLPARPATPTPTPRSSPPAASCRRAPVHHLRRQAGRRVSTRRSPPGVKRPQITFKLSATAPTWCSRPSRRPRTAPVTTESSMAELRRLAERVLRVRGAAGRHRRRRRTSTRRRAATSRTSGTAADGRPARPAPARGPLPRARLVGAITGPDASATTRSRSPACRSRRPRRCSPAASATPTPRRVRHAARSSATPAAHAGAPHDVRGATRHPNACSPRPTGAGKGGLSVPAPNVWKVGDRLHRPPRRSSTPRSARTATARSASTPTFHAGQRNDGPTCSFCHNPNRTSSRLGRRLEVLHPRDPRRSQAHGAVHLARRRRRAPATTRSSSPAR